MESELELILSTSPSTGWGTPAVKDFVAGGVGGMAGVIAGQPLDTLRIRLQQRECTSRSILGVWRGMAGAEGVRGLFRGMSYPFYTTALQNAVTFQAQRAGERGLAAAGAPGSMLSTCAAGMFAGAIQTFISSPVELLKIRMQLQRAKPGSPGYVGPLGMLRRVLAHEGPSGVFRGFGITLLRDTPSYGLYFVLYGVSCSALDSLHRRLVPRSSTSGSSRGGGGGGGSSGSGDASGAGRAWGDDSSIASSSSCGGGGSSSGGGSSEAVHNGGGSGGDGVGSGGGDGVSGAVQFVAGGLAGMLAWLSVYPLDVVKSRIQARPRRSSRYSSAWDCAVQSVREEGPGVFAKGLGATLSRAFVVNAAIFACFEACMSAMDGAPAS